MKRNLGKIIFGSFIIGITSILGSDVALADRWSAQVKAQLLVVAGGAGITGNELTHEPFIGDLGRQGRDNITLHLRRGVRYSIVGVCDEDCHDLDLVLYDDNGNSVASDTQRDDTPFVTVIPRWNAHFTIQARMIRCSQAPCRFGIGVFGR